MNLITLSFKKWDKQNLNQRPTDYEGEGPQHYPIATNRYEQHYKG